LAHTIEDRISIPTSLALFSCFTERKKKGKKARNFGKKERKEERKKEKKKERKKVRCLCHSLG